MKTPQEEYKESAKDAYKVYYDIDSGLTKNELNALLDSAHARMVAKIKNNQGGQNARS